MRRAAPDVTLSGPAPLHRLRGRTRRSLLMAAQRTSSVTGPLRTVLGAWDAELRRQGVRAGVDVDPQET
jgi:primosomal protein N'